jgi:chromosomal replication initiation ATPase DnaA
MLGARPSPYKEPAGGVEPSIELTADSLWSEVSSRLRGALNETTYRTWFNHVDGLALNDDEFVLSVPNEFTRDWIEGHFLGLIRAAIGDATGQERRVQLAVAEGGEDPAVEVEVPAPGSARRTSCRRSRSTSASTRASSRCATSRARPS